MYAGGVMVDLTDKEGAFCKAYVLNGGNQTEAWRAANPKSKAKPETQHSKASTMFAQDKVKERIEQLKSAMNEKANKKFEITVEQRLKWLKDITEAGLAHYHDGNGELRRENLAAARAAIATMNDMLGTDDENGENAQPLEIKFTVSAAKATIETTNVDRD